MQPESQNSISSAVFGLQGSLRKLQQNCTSLQKPLNDNETQPNGKIKTVNSYYLPI